MINIRTQANKERLHENVSFSYDSINAFKQFHHHAEANDSTDKQSTSRFPFNNQSGEESGQSGLIKKKIKDRKMTLYKGKIKGMKKRKPQTGTCKSLIQKTKRIEEKTPKIKKQAISNLNEFREKNVQEKEEAKFYNMPLQQKTDEVPKGFKINEIIKDTIKKNYQERVLKKKENELK